MNNFEIIPSILAEKEEQFPQLVERCSGIFSKIVIDVSDGIFTPSKTINAYNLVGPYEDKFKIDVHLMALSPIRVIDKWLRTGVERIFIHVEAQKVSEVIDEIINAGKEPGLVINPHTDTVLMEPFLDKVKIVQFMTVEPGFYGAKFIPEIVTKISNFARTAINCRIAADGGVSDETIESLKNAGVSIFAVGSYFFKGDDIKGSLDKLTSKLK